MKKPIWPIALTALIQTLFVSVPLNSYGATIDADPTDYRDKISQLEPGDTLRLAPGSYPRLSLSDLNGTEDAWISVEGPADRSAIITPETCCNTVQIRRCSYVAIRNLTVDSGGIAGLDGINAKDGASHHVLLENNRIQGVGGSQQTVGISTKSAAWGWIIRRNIIDQPGTGLYLGDSNGGAPFISGTIEGNLVLNPEGYAMQIKHQSAYAIPEAEGMRGITTIRHNVFTKDDRPSGDGNRPTLLVGPFPESGQGSDHFYEIYGNLLYGNPRESLIQAAGRVAIHDNILIGAGSDQAAVYLTDHNGPLRVAHVYNNTVHGGRYGIRFAVEARDSHSVIGNAVFSADPISGSVTSSSGNVVGNMDAAVDYFRRPDQVPGSMDYVPLANALEGPSLVFPAAYASHLAGEFDFESRGKGAKTFKGAYASSDRSPDWQLDLTRKPLPGEETVPKPPTLED
ncbi:MAG: right-handed parallel beta-helix repeat-containing protein [Roseibium album]|uniref:right-handed parallel beta-helix repeat-containing protein n=1 Tax=Roseibium album TaxID=311410 RepID=UPI0032EC085E